ncbi:MAG: type I-C CRISPR-associated protein Cas5c [Planctomycetaceae bacterium]
MQKESQSLQLRVQGPMACFTRPEMKAERVSYAVITPSAARGVLEAVFWKPAIVWRIDQIRVLNPIQWISFRRNEVKNRAVAPAAAIIDGGGTVPMQLIEDDRAQRNTVALRDVDYVIEAHFELTERAGPEETVKKFEEMFKRRVDKGQHFHQPYLGCREFIADILPVDGDTPTPISDSRDLGLMLWDMSFSENGNRPRFFHAQMQNGVVAVPADPESTLKLKGGKS